MYDMLLRNIFVSLAHEIRKNDINIPFQHSFLLLFAHFFILRLEQIIPFSISGLFYHKSRRFPIKNRHAA